MKKSIIVMVALLMATGLYAQGELDAIRMSGKDLTGTARGQAMGGAFGALGGDVTGIAINPAGLGVYRSSEVNATLNVSSMNSNTDWAGLTSKESKTHFNFDNLSYVGYFPSGGDNLKAFNFAFSYNRLKNFHRNYKAEAGFGGVNASLTDYMAKQAYGTYYDDLNTYDDWNPYYQGTPWLSILGWQSWMIKDVEDDVFQSQYPNERISPFLNVSEKGSIDSYDFSLGLNFGDQFYLGATMALTNISYKLDSYYEEKFAEGNEKAVLENAFRTRGNGYQFNAGAIWRPSDFLRLGVAYHSPTWYALTDNYIGYAEFKGFDNGELSNPWAETPSDAYTDYHFNTPYSWVFSAAGVIGTQAILSVDYEIKDYKSMNLMDYQRRELKANDYINEDFRMAATLSAGLEYRFTPQLAARLGMSYVQTPYEKEFADGQKEAAIIGTVPHYTIEGDATYVTAGFGYRFTPQFYLDLAVVYRTQTDQLYAFPSMWDNNGNYLVESTPASFKNNTCKVLATLGYKF